MTDLSKAQKMNLSDIINLIESHLADIGPVRVTYYGSASDLATNRTYDLSDRFGLGIFPCYTNYILDGYSVHFYDEEKHNEYYKKSKAILGGIRYNKYSDQNIVSLGDIIDQLSERDQMFFIFNLDLFK